MDREQGGVGGEHKKEGGREGLGRRAGKSRRGDEGEEDP